MDDTAAEYKRLKEDFVSNLTGGPVGEISIVTAVAPVRIPFFPCPDPAMFGWRALFPCPKPS